MVWLFGSCQLTSTLVFTCLLFVVGIKLFLLPSAQSCGSSQQLIGDLCDVGWSAGQGHSADAWALSQYSIHTIKVHVSILCHVLGGSLCVCIIQKNMLHGFPPRGFCHWWPLVHFKA